jgi:hypothetical protein
MHRDAEQVHHNAITDTNHYEEAWGGKQAIPVLYLFSEAPTICIIMHIDRHPKSAS